MKKLFIFSLLSVFIFSSCEDVVQIKLDKGSKLYVIDAFVNDLRIPQTIRVTSNDEYFSNKDAPIVATAQVILKDVTINKAYNFLYQGNGNYTYSLNIGDTLAKANHQYELNVLIDGITYTSFTTQKRKARIDSVISVATDGGGGGFGPRRDSSYLCFLFATDKADNVNDYYWIRTYRNDTLFNSPNDISLSIDGTNGPVSDAGVDSISFTPPGTFLGFKRYKLNDKCKAEIHSTSKETYFFLLQALQQINNGGLFATTPENVKTNIVTPAGSATKAIGWFNMASVASKEIIVK